MSCVSLIRKSSIIYISLFIYLCISDGEPEPGVGEPRAKLFTVSRSCMEPYLLGSGAGASKNPKKNSAREPGAGPF